ncbi:Ubiquitin carboxyl-terminal hydrolase 16 [Linnemannia hyalina]|uniref:ubiquitinyl hydrolase 1 n=1 Tax=Linnemannia hyalina TaxID=64524 RepID=A0A9P7Y0Q8_9FUNG|nr:Ubiquitin carboxyl-terminal hydrolase 16 [Linnemannia hyalina]
MGKKKKGGRRLSQSDFAGDDAILTEILTSSRKSGRVEDPRAERALAFPSKPVLVAAAVPEPTAAAAAANAKDASTNSVPVDSPDIVADSTTTNAAADPSELTTPSGGGGKCHHVKGAVNLAKLRKGIAHQKDWDHCLGCKAAESKAKKLAQRVDKPMSKLSLSESEGSAAGAEEPLSAESLWMCLTCYDINCGRAIKKHAVAHHDSKKNNHPLAINLGTLDCWCYECDDTIVPSKNRNQLIQECQVTFEKAFQVKQSKMRAASVVVSKKTKGAASETIIAAPLLKAKVFTPGLQNLGNTCFFNSVVQILAETKSLKSILSEDGRASSGFPKSLAASTDAGLGPLTTTFKVFLFTMWKHQGGTIAPRDLFTQIAKKWKLFRGFRQQDSQELMRYLFDGIKHEELDMIKRHLSEEGGGQDDKAEEAKDEEEEESAGSDEKKDPKFIPFIDSCFSGKLVSVIVCDACKKCSYAPEDFFDLSLPIRGPTQAGAAAGSSLKARLLTQSKKASAAKEEEPTADDTPADEKDPLPESDRPSEAHLRHVGKLLKSIGPSTSEDLSIQRSLNQFTSVDRLDGENKFACENCYKLIQATKEKEGGSVEQGHKPDANNSVSEDVVVEETAKDEPVQEVETVETTVAASESDDSESDDDDDEKSLGEEQTDSLGNTIPKKVKKVKSKAVESKKPAEEPKHIFRRAFKRYLISSLPPTLVLHLKRFESSGRFGQMRKIEDHVDIPVEIDMAPYFVPKNKIEEEEENESETGSETRKEEEEVNGSKSKKYRLYGAVVHMGTLSGGHYINYVLSSKVQVAEAKTAAEKAKSKSTISVNGLELPDVPLAVMLAQQKEQAEEKMQGLADVDKDSSSSFSATNAKMEEKSEKEVPAVQEEDKRQWIACSDSSVRLSSLQEVLTSRAYLLFYERY